MSSPPVSRPASGLARPLTPRATNRWRSWGLGLFALAVLTAVACSPEAKNEGGADDDDTTGAGGEGGAGGSGGSGGMASACPIDCSTVQTPQCQVAVCNETNGQCEIQPAAEGTSCDDGLFCTVNDYCEGGLCKGGSQNTCGMPPDPCAKIECDEVAKSCSAKPANDGTPCVLPDDNLCIINPKCQNGICTGTPKDCFFAPGGECNTLACNPATGKCEATPNPAKNGQPCSSSGDLCMVGKTCLDGQCVGGLPKDCSQFTVNCTNGVCDPATGQCKGVPIAPGEMCAAGTDDCNVGICDNNGQCQPMPANEGGPCNDGNACTVGEFCTAGVCGGGMMGQYVAYFTETFASNAAGWTLGSEWEIGPAMASNCSVANEDPAMDHTPTADNGVAGVVIGGCAATSIHPFSYLESPPVDVSQAPGQVYLEFWRHLNSDYTPFMDNVIEVWNGMAWVTIWQSGSNNPEDVDWTHVSHDITAYKNAQMKVRFGFNINSGGVFSEASWNIDDLAIANMVCNNP